MSYYSIPNKIPNSHDYHPQNRAINNRENPTIISSSSNIIYSNSITNDSGRSSLPPQQPYQSSPHLYSRNYGNNNNNNNNPMINHEIFNQNNNYEDLDNLSLPPPPPPSFRFNHHQQQQSTKKIPSNHQESNIQIGKLATATTTTTTVANPGKKFPLPPVDLENSKNSATYANLIDTFSGLNIVNINDGNHHYTNQLNPAIENQNLQNQQSKYQPPPPPPQQTTTKSFNQSINPQSISNQSPLYGNVDDYRILKNTTTNNNNSNTNDSIYGSKSKIQNIYDSIFEPLIVSSSTTTSSSLADNNNFKNRLSIDNQQQQQQKQYQPKINQPKSESAIYVNYNNNNIKNSNNNKNSQNVLKNQSLPNIKNYFHPTRSNTTTTTTISSSFINNSNNNNKTNIVKNQEEQVDHLTDLLVKSMENSGEIDFYGMCNKCGEKVVGEGSGCTAMEMVYHTQCFTCHGCNSELRGKSFYSMDNNPHCEQCYLNSLEKCSICEKPILDRILRATGKPYHPSCFTCVVCEKSLDGIPFTVDATNQVHCIDCFHNKFAPRFRVVALERSFHVNCYKCEDCDLLLSSEVEGRGCYPLDDHILCRGCNAKRVQAITG
ncbi:lipoma-preferred partner [Dermatophagoides farinae]|uniref:Lipoma-preferred partner n=1 Tax=Dermatophagoides farinae TaxID=6954 RepID=A0A9D4NWQ4_DERFA|nr:lipoma-preferred partner [Dermatophagoides farinae]